MYSALCDGDTRVWLKPRPPGKHQTTGAIHGSGVGAKTRRMGSAGRKPKAHHRTIIDREYVGKRGAAL